MEYYNNRIQVDRKVILDIFENIKNNTKMLVFGLGYDSKMWYEATNHNTFFIEDLEEYIKSNSTHIPFDNIIKYQYETQVCTSHQLTNENIEEFIVPEKIRVHAPFDIILIDGPRGYSDTTPGRLIPCYWATLLSKPGTLIYVDDSSRFLEEYCIKKYFAGKEKREFSEREGCTKILF